MSVDSNKSWSFETINGKKYFETLLSLFEVLDGPEHAQLCVESDVPGLVLFAYRNTENGNIIVPGLELQCGSLPVITDAIARAMAGKKWPTLYKNFNTTLKHELASKRALFDLDSGAQKEKVVASLEKFISSDSSKANDDDDDDDNDSWDALRQKIDGKGGKVDATHDQFNANAHRDDSDSESEDEDEKETTQSTNLDRDDLTNRHKINGGFPGVSVNVDAVGSFFGGSGDAKEFAQTNTMIQSLKEEMEQAQKSRDADDDDADNDVDDKVLKKALQPPTTHEWNGQVYPVLMPTNVVVNQHGKIVARTDAALLGRTAKEARVEQQKKEAQAQEPNYNPFATRKTVDQVEKASNLRKPKTVADELQGFGLPAEFMQDLSKQTIAKQPAKSDGSQEDNATDVQYPSSIEDILHLAKPFKKPDQLEKKDEPAKQKDSPVQQIISPTPSISSGTTILLDQLITNSDSGISQKDILRLYRAQTAQLEAMVEFNRAIQEILLSK